MTLSVQASPFFHERSRYFVKAENKLTSIPINLGSNKSSESKDRGTKTLITTTRNLQIRPREQQRIAILANATISITGVIRKSPTCPFENDDRSHFRTTRLLRRWRARLDVLTSHRWRRPTGGIWVGQEMKCLTFVASSRPLRAVLWSRL